MKPRISLHEATGRELTNVLPGTDAYVLVFGTGDDQAWLSIEADTDHSSTHDTCLPLAQCNSKTPLELAELLFDVGVATRDEIEAWFNERNERSRRENEQHERAELARLKAKYEV